MTFRLFLESGQHISYSKTTFDNSYKILKCFSDCVYFASGIKVKILNLKTREITA